MKIEVSRYRLQPRHVLNARSGIDGHDGALIRVEGGIGCIQPWPSLGDDSLAQQLSWLAAGETSPLISQALKCSEIDGAARSAGTSLFDAPIPKSHWICLPEDEPNQAKSKGFDTVKMKLGIDLAREEAQLASWADAGFRIRLDANESLSVATFLEFWEALGGLRDQIEFVEDPTEWDPGSWRVLQEVGVPVAFDREGEKRHVSGSVAVLKPAVSDWIPGDESPLVVTSYMDHPVGQTWAAFRAMQLNEGVEGDRLLTCGLLTHRCFEEDAFLAEVKSEGSRLVAPAGTGLGFDALLEELPWESLT